MQPRAAGQGQADWYFLGLANRSKQHPGHLIRPPRATQHSPPHLGLADAAAWATTSCNLAGPLTGTPTTGRLPHNCPPTALLQQPDRSWVTQDLTTGTTTLQNDRANAGSGTTGPTANQSTIGGWHRQAPTTPLQNHHRDRKQTTRKPPNIEPSGHARVKTGTASSGLATPTTTPRKQQHTTPPPLYTPPTGNNNLLQTPGAPGERKLDRVRRSEYASRHVNPVAPSSSSRPTPTGNQPRWRCLQDKASGPDPGPWAPESGGW